MPRSSLGLLSLLFSAALCLPAWWPITVTGASTNLPGDRTVLTTGQGSALITTNLALGWNSSWTSARLELDFGFATQETNSPGAFLDSFSLSLQNLDRSATALLFTADYWGVTWAPANPGGLTLDPNSLARTSIPFPNVAPTMDYRTAYSISWLLPSPMAGASPQLVLDLFDNGNNFSSLAFLDHFQLVPVTPANTGPAFALQSSAAAQGPYADETEVDIDAANKTLKVSMYGRNRFYRLQADSQVVITRFSMPSNALVFSYEFQLPVVGLQSAPNVGGPYMDVTEARVDLNRRVIALTNAPANRFYRIRSNIRTLIVNSRISGNELQLEFQYRPSVFSLQSSALAGGPYAPEANMVIDPAVQTMILSRLNSMRFFRIRSPSQHHITRIQPAGDSLLIDYE